MCLPKFIELYLKRVSFQFSSVAQSCPTLCNPTDCSTPGFRVLCHLPEHAQTHVNWVSNATQISHPLSFPPLPTSIFPSIRVFSIESALRIRWPKYWSFSFASILPMNIQDWLPLGLTGLIILQPMGLSGVFSNTKVQKYQFFSAQAYLWSNSHIHTWLQKNHSFDYTDLCGQSDVSTF